MSDTLPKQMRAVVYRGRNQLSLEWLPVPPIASNEILVKVATCGICPTDIKKIVHGTVPPPRVFGHETAGTIVRVGGRVREFQCGQRVALHHHIPCLKCHACRHRSFAQCADYKRTGITAGFEPAGGGFAEYVRVMPFVFPGIVPIPARNSFTEGAMLEPVNTVLKAVLRLGVLPGDLALVIGQGPIGLMFTRLLALSKVKVAACDMAAPKLALAKDFGARWTVLGDVTEKKAELSSIANRGGFDAVIVAIPVDQVVPLAQELTREGGKTLLFAHTRRGATAPLDLAGICVDEKDVIGSYSSDVTLQQDVAETVFSRKLDIRKLISHTFPLEEAPEAIQLAARPTTESLKILIDASVKSLETSGMHPT